MVVFGGFEKGVRTNSTIVFDFETKTWQEVKLHSKSLPAPRAGHSAVVVDDAMYIFGGKDDENEKLKDLWRFDLNNQNWQQLDSPDNSVAARSGHSCCVFNNHLIVFGGIQEITKELDDTIVFNLKTGKWTQLYSPSKDGALAETSSKFSTGSGKLHGTHSPGGRHLGSPNKSFSPTKLGKHHLGGNPQGAPAVTT